MKTYLFELRQHVNDDLLLMGIVDAENITSAYAQAFDFVIQYIRLKHKIATCEAERYINNLFGDAVYYMSVNERKKRGF